MQYNIDEIGINIQIPWSELQESPHFPSACPSPPEPNPGGYDIYMDATNGSDLNDGSEGNPIKTFAQLNGIIQAGYKVHASGVFNIDSFPIDLPFNGGLTNTGYDQYLPIAIGNGNESKWDNVSIEGNFILDGRIHFSEQDIVQETGYNNVYSFTFPRVQNKIYNYGGMWEDDTYMTEVLVNRSGASSQIANFTNVLDALQHIEDTPGTFWLDYSDPVNQKYYFHKSGTAFSARHHDFAFARHTSNIPSQIEKTFTLKGASLVGFAHHNGPVFGTNINLEDVEIIQPPVHGCILNGTHTKNTKVYYPGFQSYGGYCFHGFAIHSGAEALPITWEGCTAEVVPGAPNIAAFGSHAQPGSHNSNITIKDSESINCAKQYDFQGPINEVITDGNISTDNRTFAALFHTGIVINNETHISNYAQPTVSIYLDDGDYKMYGSRIVTNQYKVYNLLNCEGLVEIKDSIIVLNDTSAAIGFFRMIGNIQGLTIRLHRCVLVNNDAPVIDLVQLVTGVDPVLDVQNCYLYKFNINGLSDVTQVNAWNNGFNTNNILEYNNNPLTGNPLNNEWDLSGGAENIINGE